MERSVAARSPIGSLDILWRPFETAAGLARGSFRSIARNRRLRIALLTALVAISLLAGGWLLLRKSSFTAVEHVKVSGLHGPQAQAIEAALDGAASHMSTLGVNNAALGAAVASYPVVRAVHAVPSFPHGLRIDVTEQLPVAALTIGGQRTAVAADGVVLGPGLITASLPALSDPQGLAPRVGGRVQGQTLLAELAILGAEPRRLMRFDARVYSSPRGEGLTVAMRNGLLVYFGDATRPHAKWTALARVLADESSAGATYIDVRVPERPAAGFASTGALAESSASTTSAGTSGSTSATTATTPEATIAELAAKLTESTNGQPTATPGTAGAATSTSTSATTASSEPAAASTGASEPESGSGSGESSSPGGSESSVGGSESSAGTPATGG
jgi:cell division protein FtsQ